MADVANEKITFWQWTHAEPFIVRLHVIKTPWFSLCLHWILMPDMVPFEHDHTAGFLSLILRGRYTESRSGVVRERRYFNFMRATDSHRISFAAPRTLTLCFIGPQVREWGYHTPAGWVAWNAY